MQAINHYLIIDKIKEAPRLVGGLELNEKQNSDERYLKAKVVSVGNEVPVIKEGDVIRYDKHAGHGITWKDTMYQVIRGRDVILVE